jgi:hypothetical protein
MSFRVEKHIYYKKLGSACEFKQAQLIFDKAKKEFAHTYHRDKNAAFHFLASDPLISVALAFLQSKFDSVQMACRAYFYHSQKDIEKDDILKSAFVAYRGIGEDVTNCTKGNTTIPVRCSRCGLKDEDCTYLPKFKLRGRRTHLPLFSIWGMYNIFCREKFINAYKEVGLSGMSFERVDDSFFSYVPACEREDVWRVKFNVHHWGGGAKACPECGRHPTFDEADFWDADENYRYDFQLLKCRNSFARVYSLDAWKFLQEFSPFETDPEFCFCVIRPKAKT